MKFERRYIEVDEEIVSVTTDLDGMFYYSTFIWGKNEFAIFINKKYLIDLHIF